LMTSRLSATITMASLGRADKIQSQTHVSSSQLKRTTCNLCRERKVRCDREKPQCHRCHKSGQTCVYPSENTNNDEIKSALNLLHSRLRKFPPDAASPKNLSSVAIGFLRAYKCSTGGNESPGIWTSDHNGVHGTEFTITPPIYVSQSAAWVQSTVTRR
jgi:hypothetical protein